MNLQNLSKTAGCSHVRIFLAKNTAPKIAVNYPAYERPFSLKYPKYSVVVLCNFNVLDISDLM